jgi:hypothetical protein
MFLMENNLVVLIVSLLCIVFLFVFYTFYKNSPKLKNCDSKTISIPVEISNLEKTSNNTYDFIKEDIDYYLYLQNTETFLPDHYKVNYKNVKSRINDKSKIKKQTIEYNFDTQPPIHLDLQNDIQPLIHLDFHNDNQNVHDTYLQTVIKNTDIGATREDYRRDIIENCDPSVSSIVTRVVENIHKRNNLISNINKKEMEILNSVWEKTLEKPELKEEFYYQLKDCEKNGNLHCPTGVSTRLHSVLYFNNFDNYPKTKDLLKQEILQYFSKNYETKTKIEMTEDVVKEYSVTYSGEQIMNIINEFIEFI